MVWKRRPKRPAQPPQPAKPPNPAAVRRQLEVQRAADVDRWRRLVQQELLPATNAVLRSTNFVTYQVREFMVGGMRGDVNILGNDDHPEWVVFVLEAFSAPAYKGYTIELLGKWGGGGVHWRTPDIREPNIERLDKRHALREATEFARRYRYHNGHLQVTIKL